ncbi:MAG: chemotaxis protein CheX [Leptospirales bacterium]
MKEADLSVYSGGVDNYFKQFPDSKVVMKDHYPMEDKFVFLDYSAIIGISGSRKGGLYVTVPTAMIDDLITAMGVGPADDALRKDMIGEVANNIAGNAGEVFGGDFKISVPIVVTGEKHNIELPVAIPAMTIPVEWKGHTSFLVVGTE